MRQNLSLLVIIFAIFAVGCKPSGSGFGCSKDPSVAPPIGLNLGTPGETNVENKLPKNDNVHVLEADETIRFQSDDGVAIINHHEDRSLERGDIIVANSEQQYLVKVHKVLETTDGSSKVELRQSRISEIVGEGAGSLKIEATPIYGIEDIQKLNLMAQKKKGDGKTFYEVNDNGRVTIRNMELFSITINESGQLSAGLNKIMGLPILNPYEKISPSGAAGGKYRAVINEAIIDVTPTIRSDIDMSFGSLSQLKTRLDTKVRYKIDITYELAGRIQLEAIVDSFMPKKIIPIRVPGPVPVYLDVELGIPAGAAIISSGKGTTRVIYESEYEFYSEMTYDEKEGLKTDSNQRTVIHNKKITTKDKETHMEAELFLKPQITTRLYRVVGPYAYLKPYVRSEIDWPSTTKKDDLYVGVTGGVGIELSEPIFLKTIVSYDSGSIFDFAKSFDLDDAGDKPLSPLGVDPDVQNKVTVDKIGPEGFVVLDLKEDREGEFFRYELIEATQHGLMVPSETFYMDGKLYYYPLNGANTDPFKIQIQTNDGRKEIVEIVVETSDEILEEVSKERFGLTNNSYKVSSGTPGDFESDVPNFPMGGQRIAVAEHIPSPEAISKKEMELREGQGSQHPGDPNDPNGSRYGHVQVKNCVDALNGMMDSTHIGRKTMSSFSQVCPEVMPFTAGFDSQFGPKRSVINAKGDWVQRRIFYDQGTLSDTLTQVDGVQGDGGNAFSFDYYDLSKFDQYRLYTEKGKKSCIPKIQVSIIDDANDVGLRISKKLCGSHEVNGNGFSMATNGVSPPFGFNDQLMWNSKSFVEKDKSILELRIKKSALLEGMREGDKYFESSELFLAFPIFGTSSGLYVQSSAPHKVKGKVGIHPFYDANSTISKKSVRFILEAGREGGKGDVVNLSLKLDGVVQELYKTHEVDVL